MLDELDARPPQAFRPLVAACVRSAKQILEQGNGLVPLRECPACGADGLEEAFVKHGYGYRHCPKCWSLFASPRPSAEQLRWYLEDSPAAEYRRGERYVEEISPRVRELARYRASWVRELVPSEYADQPLIVVEPRSYAFPEQLYEQGYHRLVAVAPRVPAGDGPLAKSGIEVCADLSEPAGNSARVAAVFDVLEYQRDPVGLLAEVYRALAPGGYLMLSTRSASGFDIQTLWEHSDVFPLEHVNLPSVEGIRELLGTIGYQVLEISTPGLLDLQIIRRVADEVGPSAIPRFLRYFLAKRNAGSADRLQEFLQSHRLSSHMRVLARKP